MDRDQRGRPVSQRGRCRKCGKSFKALAGEDYECCVETCQDCDGSGRSIIDGGKCWECKGRGRK